MSNTSKSERARPYAGESRATREAARRERLIAAAISVFGTTGYRDATVGGVCEVAGLNKRYFYESFATLEDLLCAVYEVVVADLRRAVLAAEGNDPVTVVRGFIDGFLRWVQDNPVESRVHLFEVLGVSARVDELYRGHARSVGDELCDRLVPTIPGLEPTPGQRRFVGDALVGAGIQIAVDWVLSEQQPPREELLAELDGVLGSLLQLL
ncbi:TetR family transcriptional regulator [Flexivirga endophytica]|uniref:TetR family transcriptional regulator n=1 Tax=Flexivirga endophytica TaxID=1849103 RepID=A0A916SSL3_9MICO|nr:TetR/AcrR family transcriptional regulator [Flexivirga endophytica]GGB15675.1 TetR family transcriptional regulator [Flexivirga endophytica]GHB39924.1 TetR family transcriptional regulator [Flexivirga endophytica]